MAVGEYSFFLLCSGRDWRHTATVSLYASTSLKGAPLQTVVSDGTRFALFMSG